MSGSAKRSCERIHQGSLKPAWFKGDISKPTERNPAGEIQEARGERSQENAPSAPSPLKLVSTLNRARGLPSLFAHGAAP